MAPEGSEGPPARPLPGVVGRERSDADVGRSEERLRALTETAVDAIVTADHHGHIVSWNRAAERVFGWPEAEVVGRPLTLLMPSHLADDHRAGLDRFLATGTSELIGRTFQVVGRRRDGTELPLEMSLSSWATTDGLFFTGIVREVNKRVTAGHPDDPGGQEVALRARTSSHATEHQLRRAIAEDQLLLRYQPIVNLSRGDVVGVEALVRWHHPSRGLLYPGDFIPLAETSGLVVPLGRWVLHEACRVAADWQESAGEPRPLMLTVNVSAQQFARAGWVSEVTGALAASGLPADRLVLEITESDLMADTESSARTLAELRALGVRLAIDDFGTGYSSLAYLRRLPVDFLKIDKAFVDGVTGDPHESALARAIVKLAATLGLTTIAEGIEHREQARLLDVLGCGLGQGMWLGPPEPRATITARLRATGARPQRPAPMW